MLDFRHMADRWVYKALHHLQKGLVSCSIETKNVVDYKAHKELYLQEEAGYDMQIESELRRDSLLIIQLH